MRISASSARRPRAARLAGLLPRHAPAIVCVLLAAAILADGARATRDWWIHPPPRLVGRAGVERRAGAAREFAPLAAIGLFGAVPQIAGAGVPAEDLNLVLVGVIALPDPHQGLAILGPSVATVHSYRAGASLPGLYTLTEVYPDRVVIERDGTARVVYLPHADLAALLGTAPAEAAAATEAEAAADDAKVQATLEKNPLFLMAAGEWTFGGVNPRPRIVGGRVSGVILNPNGTGAEVATRAGIRFGDLLTEIDGQPLPDLDHLPERLRSLEGRGQVQLTVRHPSGEVAVVVVSLPVLEHGDG